MSSRSTTYAASPGSTVNFKFGTPIFKLDNMLALKSVSEQSHSEKTPIVATIKSGFEFYS